MPRKTQSGGETARYRFGFVMNTAKGNATRNAVFEKYAVRDPETDCVFAPITYWIDPARLRWIPRPLHSPCTQVLEASPVLRSLGKFDAVLFHATIPMTLALLRRSLPGSPLIGWTSDAPPRSPDRSDYPDYTPGSQTPQALARRFRRDTRSIRGVDLFVPWSEWGGTVLREDCGIRPEKIHPIHVGIDLEKWQEQPYPPPSVLKILFVGGDFERKGGKLLLDAFLRLPPGRAELHLVTQAQLSGLPPGVSVYNGVTQESPLLRGLYENSHVFALPTEADYSSFASLEAMATGRAVISTRTGGVTDIVEDGETGFLIPPKDGEALLQRLSLLLETPALCRQMGRAGRRRAEIHFSGETNVPRILEAMKAACGRR